MQVSNFSTLRVCSLSPPTLTLAESGARKWIETAMESSQISPCRMRRMYRENAPCSSFVLNALRLWRRCLAQELRWPGPLQFCKAAHSFEAQSRCSPASRHTWCMDVLRNTSTSLKHSRRSSSEQRNHRGSHVQPWCSTTSCVQNRGGVLAGAPASCEQSN